MKIGIIGSGKIGSTTARLFLRAGHDVTIANSRGPQTLAGLVGELGPSARAGTVEEAARFGDVVLVAVPVLAFGDLPPEPFPGKIVIDACNYYAPRDGAIAELDSGESTSSELLARHLQGARVVKGFNTMNFKPLGAEARPEAPRDERLAIFIAGDDDAAKRIVAELIDGIGYAAVDTGSLHEGGARQQPGSPVYNRPMTAAEAEAAATSSG